ncbi:Conserved protein of unknown function, PPE family PPE16 (fragment) [Mycobacterium canettii CIPT 140070017]
MNFLVLPPEVNSALMYAGAGSAPMLAASAAWDGLAAELSSAASSFASVTSGLVAAVWQGPAAAAMAAVAAPYSSWLSAAAAEQARAVAAVYEAARAATVPPALVAANRNQLVSLVLSNLFGQNAPAIAATEAAYEGLWAADVAAMVGYHGGASAVASRTLATEISATATWAAGTSATRTSAAETRDSSTWAAATMATSIWVAEMTATPTSVLGTWAAATWALGIAATTISVSGSRATTWSALAR